MYWILEFNILAEMMVDWSCPKFLVRLSVNPLALFCEIQSSISVFIHLAVLLWQEPRDVCWALGYGMITNCLLGLQTDCCVETYSVVEFYLLADMMIDRSCLKFLVRLSVKSFSSFLRKGSPIHEATSTVEFGDS